MQTCQSRHVMVFLLALVGVLGNGHAQSVAAPTAQTNAGAWQVDTVTVRSNTQLNIAVRLPPAGIALRHIVLTLSSASQPTLVAENGVTSVKDSQPWARSAVQLNARGIAVAYVDIPSDANGRAPDQRPQDMRDDQKQAVRYLQGKYPGIDINAGIFSSAAVTLLDSLDSADGIGKAIVVSGRFSNSRNADWRNLKAPVMLIHVPTAQCDSSPLLEAEEVAVRNHFVLVKAGYRQQEARVSCDTGSQSRLTNLNNDFAALVANWLDNQPTPDFIGTANAQTAWREQLVHYQSEGRQLEMTLLLPEGSGPFPVTVFNHGDIERGSIYFRYQTRFRDMIVAREFLARGVAVAIPARRGVGKSEGVYPLPSSSGDADATYKGRLHARDIMPALAYLKTVPDIDSSRIIISGQSAGGYSTMYIASQNPPGVIGAVNFSGGRTDVGGNSFGPGALNRTMVNAFEDAGKTTSFPILLIFAEGDSRYSANTIRHSYQAFVDAGGHATLSLSPPIRDDGHFVYHHPEMWRAALQEYLRSIGIGASADTNTAAAQATSHKD